MRMHVQPAEYKLHLHFFRIYYLKSHSDEDCRKLVRVNAAIPVRVVHPEDVPDAGGHSAEEGRAPVAAPRLVLVQDTRHEVEQVGEEHGQQRKVAPAAAAQRRACLASGALALGMVGARVG